MSGSWTHQGTSEVRRSGGLFNPRVERLFIGGRDKSSLLDGLAGQVDAVRTASATTMPLLNKQRFSSFSVPMPAAEQAAGLLGALARVAEKGDQLHRALHVVRKRRAALRGALLGAAFSGRL